MAVYLMLSVPVWNFFFFLNSRVDGEEPQGGTLGVGVGRKLQLSETNWVLSREAHERTGAKDTEFTENRGATGQLGWLTASSLARTSVAGGSCFYNEAEGRIHPS